MNSLRVVSNVRVFATQDGRKAGRTNTTHYIDPYDTHRDQKPHVYTEPFSVHISMHSMHDLGIFHNPKDTR